MSDQSVGCLLGLLRNLLGGGAAPVTNGPALPAVQVNRSFITPAEANFYRVLRQVVGVQGIILMQVSLRQLLYLPGPRSGARTSWENRLRGRSLDFVICDPQTLRPRVALELDDATHTRPHRQTRDDQVEVLLAAAGLPLLRILASRSYAPTELADALRPHFPTVR